MGTRNTDKPSVLIVDRASLDCRILEALVKPMAKVTTRCNVWRTIELLDARGSEFDTIMIEDRILDRSTVSDHLPKRRNRCRIVALLASTDPVDVRRLKACGATVMLSKPYMIADVSRVVLG